jgi:hypothetical protein
MTIKTFVASAMLVFGISSAAMADPAPQPAPVVVVVNQPKHPSTLDRVTCALTDAAYWTAYEVTTHALHHGR